MLDLRPLLRAQNYVYRVQHSDACTQVMPKDVYVNREVPPQELVASAFLKADRYQLCWRVSTGQANVVQRCELLVYLKDYTTPTLMYDLKRFPEYSVAFHLKESKYVYVAFRVQARGVVTLHSMHFMLARDTLIGHDPLMYTWDMEAVAAALRQQRLLRASLQQMYMLFEWPECQRECATLLEKWQAVFANTNHTVAPYYQNTILDCRVQAPNLLATSRESLIGSFECDDHGEWGLRLKGTLLGPTYVHAQYYIWCFPDRQIKLALRRDTPTVPNEFGFTLQGNDRPQTPIWYWLGYNFLANLPFYNLWSVVTEKLEFVNREDLLALFEQIEDHFASNELQPETNLYVGDQGV
jgi:hypothetical protein